MEQAVVMMHVDRCPKADCNARYLLIGLVVVAAETAVVAVAMRVDYDLLWPFRLSLASIVWPVNNFIFGFSISSMDF